MNILRHPLAAVIAAALVFAGCGGGGLYDPPAEATASPVQAGAATTQEAIDRALASAAAR